MYLLHLDKNILHYDKYLLLFLIGKTTYNRTAGNRRLGNTALPASCYSLKIPVLDGRIIFLLKLKE